jgi:hypothetical protein
MASPVFMFGLWCGTVRFSVGSGRIRDWERGAGELSGVVKAALVVIGRYMERFDMLRS